jgi:glutamate N-acetyltransferase/amino-acid N-acetyltransferase
MSPCSHAASLCLQRFFSSTMQNLSTQSLLLALGMGAQKTIAASAAINWLLKDGVGRIARMTVATNFGQSFDSDLKVGRKGGRGGRCTR